MDDASVPTPERVAAIWGWEKSLRAQLCVSVDESYARALAVARRWFEDGFERLARHFREVALRSTPADLDVVARLNRGLPGAVSVRLLSKFDHEYRYEDYVTYSHEAWEEMLLSLGRVPVLAALECAANDADGGSDGPYLDFIADRVDAGGGTWLQLGVKGSRELLVPGPQRVVLLEFLRGAAERANPVHGEIAWGRDLTVSVHERAMGTGPARTLPKGRWALRGYAWVTILPEEIGRRLGGLDALRDSGAFVEVEHLAGGGFWCRATDTPEQFDQPAAERVFEVVAPVLPPGQPDMWDVYPPNVLSPRDPAEI